MFVCIPNYFNNYSTRSRHASAANQQSTLNRQVSSSENSTYTTTATPATTPAQTLTNVSAVQQQQMTRSTSASSIRNTNSNKQHFELLNNMLKNVKRDRSITENGEKPSDLIMINRVTKYSINNDNSSNADLTTIKEAMSKNMSLSNSYISGSNLTSNMPSSRRERSNTKSTHIQYLKLIENNYSINIKDQEKLNKIPKDIVNKEKEIIAKQQEETQQIQQPTQQLLEEQQQMVEKNPSQERALSIKKIISSSNSFYGTSNNSKFSEKDGKNSMLYNSDMRKLPFYVDSEMYVGFLWSWNFMMVIIHFFNFQVSYII